MDLYQAVTFNIITVRIKLQSAAAARLMSMQSTEHIQTIGSVPMKRIEINVDRDVDDDSREYKHGPWVLELRLDTTYTSSWCANSTWVTVQPSFLIQVKRVLLVVHT